MPFEGREAQVEEVLDRLYEEYPDTIISLFYSDRLKLLIAVILSAQHTDERVNKVTAKLFEKYDNAAGYAAVDQEKLADDISSITCYNNKTEYIRSACADIIEKYDGEVPDTMSVLTDLAGVDQKAANVVPQHGHDVVEGTVVDTHVQRFPHRLDLTEGKHPERTEEDLTSVTPERDWQQFTHLFISHGRAVHGACNLDHGVCVLEDLCSSSGRDHDVDLASGEVW